MEKFFNVSFKMVEKKVVCGNLILILGGFVFFFCSSNFVIVIKGFLLF